MEQLILRGLRYDDAKEAATVCRKCFGKHGAPRKNYLADIAPSWRHIYLVAELAGKIVACMGARIAESYKDYNESEFDHAMIEVVAVDPDYHGQGIGTKLFAELLAAIDDKGIKFTALSVNPTNTPAIEFYEHFGFEYHGDIAKINEDIGTLFMFRKK